MKRAWCLVVALLLSACGAGGEAAGESETPSAAPAEPSATGPVYDLHEWGVVAVRPGGFEVAAGAGQPRMELNVDKPVLYVHSDEPAPFPLTVQVNLPDALHPVEHFPPTDLRPLRWRAEVGTAGCRGQYPGATDVLDARCLDGYCEVYELARYETTDARCLTVGAASAPLLFYRLWAPISPPALPLGLTLDNNDVVVTRLTPGGTQGSVIRIRRTAVGVLTSVTPLEDGQRTLRLGTPTSPASVGFAALRTALTDQGLTPPEAAAFLRGWQAALFGTSVPVTNDVDRLGADDGPSDGITADDETANRDGDRAGAPRDWDVVLYWLTPSAIDRLARIEASPPPRHLRRVFMVRHVLR
ncbi:MAG: hypothetical protein IPL19_18600 [Sandaracinaceae bacterium]|nr:hypothetical protein [Sandaracinaceae bacterium]